MVCECIEYVGCEMVWYWFVVCELCEDVFDECWKVGVSGKCW